MPFPNPFTASTANFLFGSNSVIARSVLTSKPRKRTELWKVVPRSIGPAEVCFHSAWLSSHLGMFAMSIMKLQTSSAERSITALFPSTCVISATLQLLNSDRC